MVEETRHSVGKSKRISYKKDSPLGQVQPQKNRAEARVMQQGRIALGAWIGFIPHMRHFETGPRSGFPLGMQWIYCLKAALCYQNTRINERDSNIELTQNHQPIDMLQAPLRALGEGAWLVQELGTKADFWAGSKTQSCNASHSICDALGDIHRLSATDQTDCLKKSNAIEWHQMSLNGTKCYQMAFNWRFSEKL